MRVAALYDIHGNLPALDAVLADVERAGVDRIVIGGDVVPGPLPVQTIERLSALGGEVEFVRGNGDRWVVEAFDARPAGTPGRPWVSWTAQAIDRHHRDLLASFAEQVVIDVEALGPTLFCHGSPRDDDEMLTIVTPEHRWRPALQDVAQEVVVCGHTHAQFDRRMGSWRVINAGAVGLPFEGRPGAYWLLLGPDVELRRTGYAVDRALSQMRSAGGPDVDALVTGSLIDPEDPLEVAQRLERLAG